MKKLHWHIYENGNIGMINALMSLELGVAAAWLTGRQLVAHCNRPLMLSQSMTIFDLFDVKNCIHSKDRVPAKPVNIELDIMTSVIVCENETSNDFKNGRTATIDLSKYDPKKDIATQNSKTLGFYSYVFDLGSEDKNRVLAEQIDNVIQPKSKYLIAASKVIKELGAVTNVVNVRLGDKKHVKGERNGVVKAVECLGVLFNNFDRSEILYVHTDEEKKDWFLDWHVHYKIVFLQDEVKRICPDMQTVEVGLIAALVSGRATNFVGTLYSTYSAYIQRLRRKNGVGRDFRYLFWQYSPSELIDAGYQRESSIGKYTWNRNISDKSIAFWAREYPNSWPVELPIWNEALNVNGSMAIDLDVSDLKKEIAKTLSFCSCLFGSNGSNNNFVTNDGPKRIVFEYNEKNKILAWRHLLSTAETLLPLLANSTNNEILYLEY